jgi:hypothetical protein
VRHGLARPEVMQAVDAAVLEFYEQAEQSGETVELPT